MKHVAWMCEYPPKPYAEIRDTHEGALVREIFRADLEFWRDCYNGKPDASTRRFLWKQAQLKAQEPLD